VSAEPWPEAAQPGGGLPAHIAQDRQQQPAHLTAVPNVAPGSPDDAYWSALLNGPGGTSTAEPQAPGSRQLPDVWKSRLLPGGSFVLDQPREVPSLWGSGDRVLWARGESLMVVGPAGVGKSTLAQQVVIARVGITSTVLDLPVTPTSSRVLYLACDRPPQIARSFARMVRPVDRELLDDRLVIWKGPPPLDFARHPGTLLEMAQAAGADTVVVDSVKDVALKLTDDEAGAGYNAARQRALVEGVELVELHHQTKRGAGGLGKPNTLADVYGSVWITAGAGSVLLVWGAAGDSVVEVSHLKQPAEDVGPMQVLHDHAAGRTRVSRDADPLTLLTATPGLTASQLAAYLYVPDGSRQPKNNEVEKARRQLDGLVRKDLARREEVPRGVAGGPPSGSYWPRDKRAQAAPGSTHGAPTAEVPA